MTPKELRTLLKLKDKDITWKEIVRTLNKENPAGDWTIDKARYQYRKHMAGLQEDVEATMQDGGPEKAQEYEGVAQPILDIMEDLGLDPDIWQPEGIRVSDWDGIDGERKDALKVSFKRTKITEMDISLRPVIFDINQPPDVDKLDTSYGMSVIIPDPQIGFKRAGDGFSGKYETTHDRQALASLVQFLRMYKDNIVEIVILGDWLDLAELGTYTIEPADQRTTQLAIVEGAYWLAQIRLAVRSDCKITYLEGNHEKRLRQIVLDKLPAVYGLRPGLDVADYPVLSIPNLLGFRELKIDSVAEDYPNGIYWLGEVGILHGNLAKPAGETVAKMVRDNNYSTVIGHIHRAELAWRVLWESGDTKREIFSMSPGSLCKNDGTVPANRKRNNWHKAFGVLHHHGNFDPLPTIVKAVGDTGIFAYNSYLIRGEVIPHEKALEKLFDLF